MDEPLAEGKQGDTEETFLTSSKVNLPTSQARIQAILDEVDADIASLEESDNDKKKLEAQVIDTSDIEDGREWDTDLEDEEQKVEFDVSGKTLYVETCKELGVVPASYFLRHMSDEVITMKHHGLGPLGAKSLAVPLISNTSVLTLDLEDNGLSGDGGVYLADMLKENCYIADLNLSNNSLGSLGACALCDMLLSDININRLVLAGNRFSDKDAEFFAKAILDNQTLRELDLSQNEFGHEAGMVLSYAISENETLEKLDMSWNHLRREGAIAICDGIKNNARLKSFSIAWNGLGNEGALAMAEILKFNSTLTHLDFSSNRITAEGAMIIAKGLDANESLTILKMGMNSIGVAGANLILNAINNDRSVLELLDLTQIWVDKEFDKMYREMVENGRNITIIHGGILGNYVIKGSPKKNTLGSSDDLHKLVQKSSSALEDFLKNDPMAILKQYVDSKNFRLVDFFNQFDRDKNFKITEEEFKKGVMMSNIGLTDEQVDTLIRRLDGTGMGIQDGMIDYSCFVEEDV